MNAEQLDWLAEQIQTVGTRLSWQEIAGATLGYIDIDEIDCLDDALGDKVVLRAFYCDGLSYKEIANLLKISKTSVKRHLYRIKKDLREAMKN